MNATAETEFKRGDRVRLRGDLFPWKDDPQRGEVGTVWGIDTDGSVVVQFDGHYAPHWVMPAGLDVVNVGKDVNA